MNFKLTLKDLSTTGPLKKLMDYMKPDKVYVLEIRVANDKRSLDQNQYYWAVVVPLFCQSTGYTKEEGHQYFKQEFLSYQSKNSFGMKDFTKSTADLNTADFEKYLEQCRLFCYHELNLHIPLPNELTEDVLLTLKNINQY